REPRRSGRVRRVIAATLVLTLYVVSMPSGAIGDAIHSHPKDTPGSAPLSLAYWNGAATAINLRAHSTEPETPAWGQAQLTQPGPQSSSATPNQAVRRLEKVRMVRRMMAPRPFQTGGQNTQIAGGAVVRHAPSVSGRVEGSVRQLLGEDVTLNSGAVITGDLIEPGTPQLT